MLKTLTTTHHNIFGDAVEVNYKRGEVHNFPPHFAASLIKKGIACHA